MTTWVGRISARGARPGLAILAMRRCVARRPSSWIGWLTVVSGGSMIRLGYRSSNPVTATSAGTRTPARCSSRTAPIAIWSFAHATACGRATS
jgi:hypothetical protein